MALQLEDLHQQIQAMMKQQQEILEKQVELQQQLQLIQQQQQQKELKQQHLQGQQPQQDKDQEQPSQQQFHEQPQQLTLIFHQSPHLQQHQQLQQKQLKQKQKHEQKQQQLEQQKQQHELPKHAQPQQKQEQEQEPNLQNPEKLSESKHQHLLDQQSVIQDALETKCEQPTSENIHDKKTDMPKLQRLSSSSNLDDQHHCQNSPHLLSPVLSQQLFTFPHQQQTSISQKNQSTISQQEQSSIFQHQTSIFQHEQSSLFSHKIKSCSYYMRLRHICEHPEGMYTTYSPEWYIGNLGFRASVWPDTSKKSYYAALHLSYFSVDTTFLSSRTNVKCKVTLMDPLGKNQDCLLAERESVFDGNQQVVDDWARACVVVKIKMKDIKACGMLSDYTLLIRYDVSISV